MIMIIVRIDFVDFYFWFEDKDGVKLLVWVEVENVKMLL